MKTTVFYGSKTIWMNFILIATPILALIPTSFDLPEWAIKAIMFTIGVLGILNRVISKDSNEITLTDETK